MSLLAMRRLLLLAFISFLSATIGSTAVIPAATAQSPNDNFVILFDISGSMNDASDTEPGKKKIDVAKTAIKDAVLSLEPGSVDIGLRSFSGCGIDDSTLVSSPEPVNPGQLAAEIEALQARGRTGIETALRDAVGDLSGEQGEKVILLISDGEETCGGDPCEAMSQIVAGGVNVVVNTIGFQTAGTEAEPQLKCIADTTGGSSISVTDADEIAGAIIGSVQDPKAVCTGDLVTCFAPELRFHPNETHFPMNPTSWLSQSELKWAANAACLNPVVTVQGELTASNLNNHIWYEHENLFCRLTDRRASATDFTAPFRERAKNGQERPLFSNGNRLPVGEGFYVKHVTGDDKNASLVAVPTFYVITQHNGLTEINYWTFYGFDPKSGVASGLQHQGDWEHIVVLVNPDNSLHSVRYAGHGCDPIELTPSDPDLMLVDDTHPVILVARGSHASWPYEHDNSLSGWPGCGASGTTDETVKSGGKTLRSWEQGIFDLSAQNWYGFGGRWGDTARSGIDDKHGPVGPPFSISKEYLPYTESPLPRSDFGRLQAPAKVQFAPLEVGTFEFLDGLPGRNFVAVLESLPTVVGSGQFDNSGRAVGDFLIPSSAAPGTHKMVIRDADTGEVLGTYPLWVDVPENCGTEASAPDQDGDGLADICDDDPADGPNADFDGDGISNGDDNCPTIPNQDQAAEGERTVGDACNSVLGVNPVPTYPVKTAPEPTPTPTPMPTPSATATPAPVATTTPTPPPFIICEKGVPLDTDGDGFDDQCSETDFDIVHTPDGLLDDAKPLIVLPELSSSPSGATPAGALKIGFTG